MSAPRVPMMIARNSKGVFSIFHPGGKHCSDCYYFAHCRVASPRSMAGDQICSWDPTRFTLVPATAIAKPDWTPEEEEQFRALDRQQAEGGGRG